MDIEFDPEKDDINRNTHGVSLRLARDMDFRAALIEADQRYAYGETDFRHLAP